MISIENLTFIHPGGNRIFDKFDLTIGQGESWSIIGPSGCGKTTLLYLIAGLLQPEGGQILIKKSPVTRPRPRTGLVLQDHGLLPWATVFDNSMLGFKIRSFYGPDGVHSPRASSTDRIEETQKVNQWLEQLGISGVSHKYPGQLSRGQCQRAAIVRTQVLDPDLMLMDEPFSALDAPIRKELQQVMNQLHQQTRRTSIIVTHDIEEAVIMGSKILVLTSGVNQQGLVFDNPLAADPKVLKTRAFDQMCDTLHQAIGSIAS